MDKNETLDFDFSFIAAAIAGVVSVAAVDDVFDLTDSAIGFILLMMMWPTFFIQKTLYLRVMIATVTGMCLLLMFGFSIEIIKQHYQLNTEHQILHFLTWLLFSIASFTFLHSGDKKRAS